MTSLQVLLGTDSDSAAIPENLLNIGTNTKAVPKEQEKQTSKKPTKAPETYVKPEVKLTEVQKEVLEHGVSCMA